MTGRSIKTFMTAVFELKSPTKTKTTVLNYCFLNYHNLYEELLEDAKSSNLDRFIKSKTYEIRNFIKNQLKSNPVFANKMNKLHLSLAMEDGLSNDLAASIQSYCELKNDYNSTMENAGIADTEKEKLSLPGLPTISPLIARQENWENRLEKLATASTLDDENEARDQLLKENKAGQFRPIVFPRHRLADGFYMLQHKTKPSFYILFNLYKKESRFSRKIDLSQYKVLGTEKTHKHTAIGLVFPINFGKSYQYDRFLRWIAENNNDVLDAPIIKPKTARLCKKGDRFEAHVSFEITREAKEPLTWLGVDRGIHNIASLCVIRENGEIIAEKNFTGKQLKYVQKKMERRQKTVQKKGKKYRSATRLSEAKKAIHGIANRIVEQAKKHHAQVVIEHLGNLTSRNKKRNKSNFNRLLGRQQYSKLKDVLEYKLSRAGLPKPLSVSAAYTSSTCPKCGVSDQNNRDRNDPNNAFCCQNCGYKHDADLNAARMIALKKIWRNGLPKNKKTLKVSVLDETDFSLPSFLKRLNL